MHFMEPFMLITVKVVGPDAAAADYESAAALHFHV
jgi:hypothetical protein